MLYINMWSWLETPNLKVTDIPSEDVNKIITGLEEKQKEETKETKETEEMKEMKETKETEETEETEDEIPELEEAKWEKDLDEKCERQCSSICSKTVKFKIQRIHLVLIVIAYVANISLFMYNKKCK